MVTLQAGSLIQGHSRSASEPGQEPHLSPINSAQMPVSISTLT